MYLVFKYIMLTSSICYVNDVCFGRRCLEFWYHMYGAGIGALYVYQFDPSAQVIRPSWMKLGNMGDMWWRGTMTLSNIGKPYNVMFEGKPLEKQNNKKGKASMGGISIIYTTSGSCSELCRR